MDMRAVVGCVEDKGRVAREAPCFSAQTIETGRGALVWGPEQPCLDCGQNKKKRFWSTGYIYYQRGFLSVRRKREYDI